MFTTNSYHRLLKKMKRSGICVMGTVTGITEGHVFSQDVREIFGETEISTLVTVSYKTRQNTDEVMILRFSERENNPYAVGDVVEVRYLFENGHYQAIPEKNLHETTASQITNTSKKSLHKVSAPDSSDRPKRKAEMIHILGTVLLAIGVFAVSAGITAAVILWCFSQ